MYDFYPSAGIKRTRLEETDQPAYNDVYTNSSSNKVPRRHCKISPLVIVNEVLADPSLRKIMRWREVGKVFEINWENFARYYRYRGPSSASSESIRNHFMRKNHGFEMLRRRQAYIGYDSVLTHVTWKEVEDEFIDGDALNIIKQIVPDFNETKNFHIDEFLEHMQKKRKFNMTDEDKSNFKILLKSELGPDNNNSNMITFDKFRSFLIRFGPLLQSVQKVRNFVEAGASSWFHGLMTSSTVEKDYNPYLRANDDTWYYLIRSVPIDEKDLNCKYVFAVSLMNRNEFKHLQIFLDYQNQLFMFEGPKEPVRKYFACFGAIIEAFNYGLPFSTFKTRYIFLTLEQNNRATETTGKSTYCVLPENFVTEPEQPEQPEELQEPKEFQFLIMQ
jgi:hypothetical protein